MVGQISLQTRVIVHTPLLLILSPWAEAFLCGEFFGYCARQQIVGNRRKHNFSAGESTGKSIRQGKAAIGKTNNSQRPAEAILNLLKGPA